LEKYRALFKKNDQQGKPTDAVVNVSYTETKSYAMTAGRRLLTADEWDAASVTPGFIVPGPTFFEWVDSPHEKQKTVKQHGKAPQLPDQAQKHVTFRTAKNL